MTTKKVWYLYSGDFEDALARSPATIFTREHENLIISGTRAEIVTLASLMGFKQKNAWKGGIWFEKREL